MNKELIINEIKRTALDNSGAPLGQEKFSKVTEIRKSDWFGKYWVRWSDALLEAGFSANSYNEAYTNEFIFESLAKLTRELGHFPVSGDIRIKAAKDKDFPSHSVFNRVGNKDFLINGVRNFCSGNSEYSDVLNFMPNVRDITVAIESAVEVKKGYVYLIQHGNRKEYKIGRTNNPIRREGELSIELPEKVEPLHWIETDDPSGIEKYWHNRFASKRKNGEWFDLSVDDVRAFKRWKKIF
ncbi:GIY-YIG nuclease family protein [Deefgea tanakiae]|uniref:GIY-YIG nuclease family protein n=1 Tax=Deefgea tanakiae TaxID=2865840 RepID=A0ABX8Z9Y8_9NEIS|nr:GIY-YIG nuclease family protein [Deefgea tanakiae]QZA79377.1 GIY-YIG nuclease family protein [Deefgea tanakiae]